MAMILVIFCFLSCVPFLVLGPPLQVSTPSPGYGQTNVGGLVVNKGPVCRKFEKVIFTNKCEPYTERTCRTRNEEECNPQLYKSCIGGLNTDVESACFNETELICNLVETVHHETVMETYHVHRCITGVEPVCDTTYDIDISIKEDYQCCNVETSKCSMQEKTINDVKCTDTVVFDCTREKGGYGQNSVVCKGTPKKDCQDIPRKIKVEDCKPVIQRYCKPVSNRFPFLVEKKKCHIEPKEICELEKKTRPQKVKKYSYKKECKEQPKEICHQWEKKSIQPLCEWQERRSCVWKQKREECSEVTKNHCSKVPEVVVEEVCGMVDDLN